MRDIKFRAWDVYNKKIIYDFIIHSNGCFIDKYGSCECDEAQEYGLQRISGIDKQYVMQYTGLKDKNGKDIYDKDVVFIGGSSYVVEFRGYNWSFNPKHAFDSRLDFNINPNCIEIIGNTYENK